ncbi:MAG: TrmH family RNA methyltransferase, partial [Calditrichaceae bacterium]
MLPISRSLLSRYASLKKKKYRDQFKLYAISGLNAVSMAIKSASIRLEAMLVREDRVKEAESILNQTAFSDPFKIFKLSPREFGQFSDEQNPQGLALIVHKPDSEFEPDSFYARHFIYLDRINDPGNLGTIIRTAAWFDISMIFLSPGSADPFQPKTTRSSAGIISHLKVIQNVEPQILKTLNQKFNIKLIGACAHKNRALDEFKFDPNIKYGFIFGSEAHGIGDEIQPLLDAQIQIPCAGMGESLNLAASTAIFLYSFRQQI